MKEFRLSTEIRASGCGKENKQYVVFQFGILQIMNNYARGNTKKSPVETTWGVCMEHRDRVPQGTLLRPSFLLNTPKPEPTQSTVKRTNNSLDAN